MSRILSQPSPLLLAVLLLTFAGAAAAEHGGAASAGSDLRELWPLVLPGGTVERALFGATVDGERCLWSSDGTAAGTFRVEVDGGCLALRPDSPFVGSAEATAYLVAGAASDRFWRSDGTAAGTWPLMGFSDPGLWDRRSHFVAAPEIGLVLFLADDSDGVSLWASDDSPESAVRLDVPGLAGTVPFLFQVLGARVFFFVHRDGFTYELWVTDGTSAGTALVRSLGSAEFPAGPQSVRAVGDRLIFFLGGATPCAVELWASDGTGAGTVPIRELSGPSCPAPGPRQTIVAAGFAGSAFFAADDGVNGAELWHTDGTPAGTYALTDLAPAQPFPAGFPETSRPAALGGRLFFSADGGGGSGTELWASDGIPEGAALVADLCPGPCSSQPGPLGVVAGRLVFAATDAAAGRELWTSDGTAAGTSRRTDLCPGACGAEIQREVVFGGSLLFLADDGASGQELWRFAPPAGPAVRLTDLAPPRPFDPSLLVQPLGGRAVFAADDGTHGREPWVTDGTPGGTHLLADLQGPAEVPGIPAPPSDLALEDLGGGLVRLTWKDNSDDEDGFLVEIERLPEPPLTLLAAADETSLTVQLAPGRYRFRVRSFKAFVGASAPSNEIEAVIGPSGTCTPSEEVLCLGGGRFRVSVDWRNQHAAAGEPDSGPGRAVPAGPNIDDSGYFWFFTEDNLELVVKVLDGTPVNGHYWVFWGALSDVEYTIRIEDTTTGETAEYHNPPGQICGGSDTTAFPLDGGSGGFARTAAVGSSRRAAPAGGPFAAASGPATRFLVVDAPATLAAPLHPPQPCVPDDQTLCLLDGTLAVTVEWRDQHNGGSGVGQARPYTDLTGFFWFFHPENVELVVKALDGRTVNGKIWVFYGALSDVGYTIRVLHDEAHQVRTYENPPGVICGRGDTAAF